MKPTHQNADTVKALLNQANHAKATGDRETELAIWQQLNGEASERDPRLLYQIGSAFIAHEQYDEIQAILEELVTLAPEGRIYRLLAIEYWASRRQTDHIVNHLNDWISKADDTEDLIAIAEVAWTYTGHTDVFKVFEKACLKAIPSQKAIATGAIFHMLDPIEHMKRNSQSRFDLEGLRLLGGLAEALIDQGQIRYAQALISSVSKSLTGDQKITKKFLPLLSELYEMCSRWQAEDTLPRPLIEEDFTKDVILSKSAEPGKLAVIFAGWNGRPLVGSRILDNQLAQMGYQTLFLRDANGVGFGSGIQSLGSDRSETLSALDKIIKDTGATDPVFIGASIGTFGAISHGLPLGIRRLALFGPVTSAGDRAFLHALGDFRGGVLLNKTSRDIPVGEQLMSDFINRAEHDFTIKAVVGDAYPIDIKYAESIAHHDQVEVVKIQNFAEHNTLRPAIARSLLESIVEA